MDPQAQTQPAAVAAPEARPVVGPDAMPISPNTAPVATTAEMSPAPMVVSAGAVPIQPPPVQPIVAAVPPPMADPLTAITPTPAMAGPAIAEDVDVIEKEWVDRAQDVVRATSDDPYSEEEAVETLQIDYLKKRYGKDITKPEPGK